LQFTLLINSDENQTKAAITKVIKEVMNVIKKNKWPVSLSIGVMIFIKLPKSAGEALKMADDLMYEVKAKGKNNTYYKLYA